MYASLVLALLQTSLSISTVPNWNHDYRLAMDLAASASKPLAVVIGTGPAGYESLSSSGRLDPQTRRLLAEKYVCLYVDASHEAGWNLASAFEATILPTLVISDRSRGYQAFRQTGPADGLTLNLALERYSSLTHEPAVVRQSYYQPARVQVSSPAAFDPAQVVTSPVYAPGSVTIGGIQRAPVTVCNT